MLTCNYSIPKFISHGTGQFASYPIFHIFLYFFSTKSYFYRLIPIVQTYFPFFFSFVFVCFFSLLMEGYKKDVVFQLSESLVPCPSFSPDTLVKAHFYAAYPLIQTAFWLPLSFPSKLRLPLSVFIWLLLTYTASRLLFPP